jgi:hypothetical protein
MRSLLAAAQGSGRDLSRLIHIGGVSHTISAERAWTVVMDCRRRRS